MAALTPLRFELRDEAERLHEDSLYSEKNNFEAGQWWSQFNDKAGAPGEILTTILAGGAGINVLLDGQPLLTAGLAIASAVISALRTFFKPAEKAEAYTLKGSRYNAIRNEARIFRNVDVASGLSDDELRQKLDDLRKRYNDLNQMEPLVMPRRHFEAARRNIEAGEPAYAIDRRQADGV